MQCRVCHSNRVSFLCEVPNSHTSSSILESYRCNECGSAFIGNDISNDELGEAYASIDTGAYYDEVEAPTKRKMNTVVSNVKDTISKSDKILDIGAGGGHLIRAFNENGFEKLYAHEVPSSGTDGIEDVTEEIYHDFDYQTIPSDEFDLVTLIDVLEHVPDPSYLIQNCIRILKPNGVIYLHTPVVSKLDHLMYALQNIPAIDTIGKAWQRSRTSIFHLSIFTRESLAFLFEQSGFSNQRIESINELSWPVSRYIQTYITSRFDLPDVTTKVLTPFLSTLLKSQYFNSNKAIATAQNY